MISIHDLLKSATDKLKHLETASLDSEVLLSYVLKKPREYILAHGESKVPSKKAEQFSSLVARRGESEPLAYLIKRKEFYGRNFFIDERVHIPRPATEDLINYIKESIPASFDGTFADIGTGSGCVAITLALEFPQSKMIATDISSDALEVAEENARSKNVDERIVFLLGDLLSPLTEPIDVLASNPPYGWGKKWTSDAEVFFQPKISHESGTDGLDIIKRLIIDLPDHLNSKGRAFIEFDPRQTQKIKDLASSSDLQGEIKKDSAGFERVLILAKQK